MSALTSKFICFLICIAIIVLLQLFSLYIYIYIYIRSVANIYMIQIYRSESWCYIPEINTLSINCISYIITVGRYGQEKCPFKWEGAEWEIATRDLSSWPLAKALSHYHIPPHLPPFWSFSMPFIMRQHYCVTALWMLQGASCLKAPNFEDLSWVDLNPVTKKGSKWGPYMLSGRGMYFKTASEGKAKPWVGKFLPFSRKHFSNVPLPFPYPILFPHFTCWYWAMGNQCNCIRFLQRD